MDRTANSAPLTRSERFATIAGCAMDTVFVLSGIDLRAVALGGLWLRDIAALKHAHDNS